MVMKNCDPLVLGPLFAMESRPGLQERRLLGWGAVIILYNLTIYQDHISEYENVFLKIIQDEDCSEKN